MWKPSIVRSWDELFGIEHELTVTNLVGDLDGGEFLYILDI